MKPHFQMFAAYNAWANARLYTAAAGLADADYRRDCGAFFGSLHGTLNHLMVADLIWIARFRGQTAPLKLDQILHEDLAELTAARRVLDADIVRLIDAETEESLKGSFTYTPITIPEPVTQEKAPAYAHFFNHQTHHRGQCHAMLTRLGAEAPPLDLLYFQREG